MSGQTPLLCSRASFGVGSPLPATCPPGQSPMPQKTGATPGPSRPPTEPSSGYAVSPRGRPLFRPVGVLAMLRSCRTSPQTLPSAFPGKPSGAGSPAARSPPLEAHTGSPKMYGVRHLSPLPRHHSSPCSLQIGRLLAQVPACLTVCSFLAACWFVQSAPSAAGQRVVAPPPAPARTTLAWYHCGVQMPQVIRAWYRNPLPLWLRCAPSHKCREHLRCWCQPSKMAHRLESLLRACLRRIAGGPKV